MPAPSPTPGAAGGKGKSGGRDKALERATAAAAGQGSGGAAGGGAAPMPLTARNLVLKEKIERKAEGKRGAAPRGEAAAVDDDELRAIEGTCPPGLICFLSAVLPLSESVTVHWRCLRHDRCSYSTLTMCRGQLAVSADTATGRHPVTRVGDQIQPTS